MEREVKNMKFSKSMFLNYSTIVLFFLILLGINILPINGGFVHLAVDVTIRFEAVNSVYSTTDGWNGDLPGDYYLKLKYLTGGGTYTTNYALQAYDYRSGWDSLHHNSFEWYEKTFTNQVIDNGDLLFDVDVWDKDTIFNDKVICTSVRIKDRDSGIGTITKDNWEICRNSPTREDNDVKYAWIDGASEVNLITEYWYSNYLRIDIILYYHWIYV